MKKTISVITIMLIIVSASGQTQVKPTVQKADTSYALIGNKNDFNLLRVAVASPGDVTPNQVSALLNWLRNIVMVNNQPVADKPKQNNEKPKEK